MLLEDDDALVEDVLPTPPFCGGDNDDEDGDVERWIDGGDNEDNDFLFGRFLAFC